MILCSATGSSCAKSYTRVNMITCRSTTVVNPNELPSFAILSNHEIDLNDTETSVSVNYLENQNQIWNIWITDTQILNQFQRKLLTMSSFFVEEGCRFLWLTYIVLSTQMIRSSWMFNVVSYWLYITLAKLECHCLTSSVNIAPWRI